MSNDPWATAGVNTQAPQQDNSQLTDGLPAQPAAPGLGGGALFGGGGKSYPSLFNKTHQAGTERSGVVTDVRDVHSRELVRDEKTGALTAGGLKYWEDGNSGKGVRPVTSPVSTITGKANRPVMDTHIVLSTEYRMTEQEARAVQRSADFVKEDDGTRVYVVGDLKAAQTAIADFNAQNPATPITSPADLIGKRLTVIRENMPGERRQEQLRFTVS